MYPGASAGREIHWLRGRRWVLATSETGDLVFPAQQV